MSSSLSGILATIAISVLLKQRRKGYDAAAEIDARNLATLEETYIADTAKYKTEAHAAGATVDLK